MYDASIGRWHTIDPLAEKGHSYSPYIYVLNNPILKLDIGGLWGIDVHLSESRNRGDEGILVLRNDKGEVVKIWRAGGRGSKSIRDQYSSAKIRRQKTNGDTPLGTWNILGWRISTESERETFGFYRLNLGGYNGEYTERQPNTIRVHGALKTTSFGKNGENNDGSLWNTGGCVRMSLRNMSDLWSESTRLNEDPTTLSVSNDLYSNTNLDDINAIIGGLENEVSSYSGILDALDEMGVDKSTGVYKFAQNEKSFYSKHLDNYRNQKSKLTLINQGKI